MLCLCAGTSAHPMEVEAPPSDADAAGPSADVLRPFAVVDELADASPASTAGIQIGDQMCRWVWRSRYSAITGRRVSQKMPLSSHSQDRFEFAPTTHQIQCCKYN